ncbi:MAG: DoxX family membrane protein [Acidobacteriia bacterium]|nr:DoxX family membrane protein [Terriglobia bacterium]
MLLFIDCSEGLGCPLHVNLTAGGQSKNITKKLTNLGRAFFAIAMAAFGIQYFIHALAASVPALGPPWTPTPPFWGYVTAIILVAAAAGIATGTLTRCAAISLGIMLLVRVLLAYVPRLAANIHDPGPWTSGSELLALCGAALVLAGAPKLGRILFAAPLVVFGVQHFLYARFIATLVPAWIPGRLFWAYFVGVAFLCTAVSIAAQKMARLFAILLGLMFFLWVLIVHLPRVTATPHNGNEWTSLFVALAMSGGALLIAGSVKGGWTFYKARASKR